MGIILNWSSSYPASLDDAVTNFPTVTDNVHDVLASHVNALAASLIAVEGILGGMRSTGISSALSPSDGDVLQYNNSTGKWESSAASGLISLQDSYDGGETVTIAAGTPIAITTPATNQTAVTVTDGADTLSLYADGLELPDGKQVLPGLRFASAPTSGIWLDTADIVCGLGDAERVRVSASGLTVTPAAAAASSGVENVGLALVPTINQSGTAGYEALSIFVTESATGSGDRSLINAQVGGVSQFRVGSDGALDLPAAQITAGGEVLAGDGVASLPGQAFQSEPATGWYLNGPADLRLSVNAVLAARATSTLWQFRAAGGLMLTVQSSGVTVDSGNIRPGTDDAVDIGTAALRWQKIYMGTGTTSDPSFALGTANTGISSPNTNQLSLITNGAERWRFLAAGEMCSPANGTAAAPRIRALGEPTGIYWAGNSAMGFSSNGDASLVSKHTLDTDGDRGLEVIADVNQSGTAGYEALSIFVTESATGSGDRSLINAQVGGVSQFRVTSDGTTQITTAGSVGTTALSVGGEEDVGLTRPSSGVLGLVGGGTLGLSVSAAATTVEVALRPGTDDSVDLGTAALRWQRLFLGSGTSVTDLALAIGQSNTGLFQTTANRFYVALGGVARYQFAPTDIRSETGAALGTAGRRWSEIFLGAGTATAPSVSLNENTGIYLAGAGALGVTVSGVDNFFVTAGQFRSTVDGTKTTPFYTWNVDRDTGIYRAGADELGLAAGGNVLFWNSTSFSPDADNAYSLGAEGLRYTTLWSASLDTGDVNLHGQSDDAHWTLVEDRRGLFLRDRVTGRAYQISMTEIEPADAPRTFEELHG